MVEVVYLPDSPLGAFARFLALVPLGAAASDTCRRLLATWAREDAELSLRRRLSGNDLHLLRQAEWMRRMHPIAMEMGRVFATFKAALLVEVPRAQREGDRE